MRRKRPQHDDLALMAQSMMARIYKQNDCERGCTGVHDDIPGAAQQ
jgi:hypothetical protein